MIVTVTRKHIEVAQTRRHLIGLRSTNCPFALAIREQVPDGTSVIVGLGTCKIGEKTYDLTKAQQLFIRKFDRGELTYARAPRFTLKEAKENTNAK